MTEPSIAAARGILADADRALEQAERQLEKVRAEIDAANRAKGELVAERAEHEHALANATARHQQECEARRRELRAVESDLAARERAVEEKSQRADATMRAAEMRAADLSNRLHGHAA
jgi:chromosome segregation ATPase